MSIRSMLPSTSKYWKASDVAEGTELELVADRLEQELIGDEKVEKPVLYFLNQEKRLVMNRTNNEVLAIAANDDPSSVAGPRVFPVPGYGNLQREFGSGTADSVEDRSSCRRNPIFDFVCFNGRLPGGAAVLFFATNAGTPQMQPVELLLSKLPDANPNGNGWSARCPAHEDRRPSLSIAEGDDGRALVRCHAGCTVDEICAAVGLRVADLMPVDVDTTPRNPRRKQVVSTPKTVRSFKTAKAAIKSLERKYWQGISLLEVHQCCRRTCWRDSAMGQAQRQRYSSSFQAR